jgi:hypothetical protein
LKKSRYWKQWWMRTWAIFTVQIIIWLHTYMVVLLPKPCWKGTISIHRTCNKARVTIHAGHRPSKIETEKWNL